MIFIQFYIKVHITVFLDIFCLNFKMNIFFYQIKKQLVSLAINMFLSSGVLKKYSLIIRYLNFIFCPWKITEEYITIL